ncbi:phenylalanine--tRNA ligase, chloroplastic/mitochondrial-like [Castanea sativa]|uniref:phenylalanine--tRNA ligase, chloroplastic/mitochondrial-like n=1 Tax=Castanea sativa TaxID=21020 RepID=UPI003F64F3BC
MLYLSTLTPVILTNKFDDLCPIVTVKQNFDDVLVPADHVSRSYNDTYYIDPQSVLRCHRSAHQAELLRRGHTHFLVTGDVYCRDSIDSTHYPVFHQMEGVSVFSPDDWEASGVDATSYAAEDLKKCLEGLANHLFGAVEMRWIDTYFPFTNPSFELEIYFQVLLIDNFTNKKGMTSHCYRIAYRLMERSLTDDEINELQNVREQVQSKLNVVLR